MVLSTASPLVQLLRDQRLPSGVDQILDTNIEYPKDKVAEATQIAFKGMQQTFPFINMKNYEFKYITAMKVKFTNYAFCGTPSIQKVDCDGIALVFTDLWKKNRHLYVKSSGTFSPDLLLNEYPTHILKAAMAEIGRARGERPIDINHDFAHLVEVEKYNKIIEMPKSMIECTTFEEFRAQTRAPQHYITIRLENTRYEMILHDDGKIRKFEVINH